MSAQAERQRTKNPAEQLTLWSEERRHVQLPWELVIDETLTASRKSVFAAVVSFADCAGHCQVSHKAVAARAGVGRATVQRALDELAVRGFVAIIEDYRGGQQLPNLYSVIRPKPKPKPPPDVDKEAW